MREHVSGRIDDYLLGEMDSHGLQSFERHVEECRSCSNELRDAREAQSYLKLLRPVEAPPAPGPDFYLKVQRSIEKKANSGWLSSLPAAFQNPRFAFSLLFLFLGLLVTAWNMDFESDLTESGILGIPPSRFSDVISSEADRAFSRDLVMVSLVEEE